MNMLNYADNYMPVWQVHMSPVARVPLLQHIIPVIYGHFLKPTSVTTQSDQSVQLWARLHFLRVQWYCTLQLSARYMSPLPGARVLLLQPINTLSVFFRSDLRVLRMRLLLSLSLCPAEGGRCIQWCQKTDWKNALYMSHNPLPTRGSRWGDFQFPTL